MEGVQKQLRRACGGSPRETCLGHTGRGMDPGRDRVGQKNKLTYRLARKGSRPRASHDQRTQSTYLSARYARKTRSRCRPRAACSFISTRSPPRSPPGGHAILLLDQVG